MNKEWLRTALLITLLVIGVVYLVFMAAAQNPTR